MPTPTSARCVASTGRLAATQSASRLRTSAGAARTARDEVANGLALCALHHVLLDLGALGLTRDRLIRVSALFVARSEAGRAVDALAGRSLLVPRPGRPVLEPAHIDWHTGQVFKNGGREAA